jgi:DNA/RNA-binding domain of Phe-tRNA-synthetase-like protein
MPVEPVLVTTPAWRHEFPGAIVGALAMSAVHNPALSPDLEVAKRRLEEELRAGASDDVEPVLQAYAAYYCRRGATYHVKTQRESVVSKGRLIPSRAALVEAMFMAELRNAILTAGHDRDRLELPVRADVSLDGDRYVLLGGAETVLEAGEMLMADGTGIVSSILRGPDRRTRIVTETRGVLFAVYAPAGIGDAKVRRHLDDIRANVELIAPGARTESTIVLGS